MLKKYTARRGSLSNKKVKVLALVPTMIYADDGWHTMHPDLFDSGNRQTIISSSLLFFTLLGYQSAQTPPCTVPRWDKWRPRRP